MSDDKMREAFEALIRRVEKLAFEAKAPNTVTPRLMEACVAARSALTQQPESKPAAEVMHCYDAKGRDSVRAEIIDYSVNAGDLLYTGPQPSAQVPEGSIGLAGTNPTKTGLYRVTYKALGLEGEVNEGEAFIAYCTCHGWAKHCVDIWSPSRARPKQSAYVIENMIRWDGFPAAASIAEKESNNE